jgi:hypothetical protein
MAAVFSLQAGFWKEYSRTEVEIDSGLMYRLADFQLPLGSLVEA